MAITRKKIASALVILGGAAIVTGVAMVCVPGAFVVAGVGLGAAGLFAVEVDG